MRQHVGYARFDTPAELEVPATSSIAILRLYVNFFQPQMKLVSKTRRGATVTKHFDQARTPYRRILASAVGLPAGQDDAHDDLPGCSIPPS